MNKYKLEFQHFGMAVRENQLAIKFLTGLGYRIGSEIEDSLQDVFVLEATHENMPTIEIVWPRSSDGPLESILSKGNGLIYHSCFRTINAKESISLLEQDGFQVRPIVQPTKAPLFNNQKVSFYYVSGYGLIELLETIDSH